VNLRAAFLAQEALQNSDGTFMVWRGGITDFQVAVFPIMIKASLVLRIEADAQEARLLHHIRFRVVHAGEEHQWQQLPVAFKDPPHLEASSYLNLLVTLHVGITRPGEGRVDVVVDEELISPHIPFTVVRIPLPPGFPTVQGLPPE
jgi:hypothetical protein